jgi:hypothetical protein
MGIRFYCPNGHKLNVKVFQAGRRGICPYCGERFFIPTQSTRKSSKEERAALRSLAMASSPMNPSAMPPNINLANTAATISGRLEAMPSTDALAAFAPAAPVDPFIEAGDVVWYVRPPAGGQYGPANNMIMQRWLSEGRITPDTLIWREGWRDWQEASRIFHQLRANNKSEDYHIEEPFAQANSPVKSMTSRSRDPQNLRMIVIALIILTSIIILSMLVWVITHGSTSGTKNPNTPSTRLELRDTFNPSRIS